MRELSDVMTNEKVRTGVFLTTSSYTEEAVRSADGSKRAHQWRAAPGKDQDTSFRCGGGTAPRRDEGRLDDAFVSVVRREDGAARRGRDILLGPRELSPLQARALRSTGAEALVTRARLQGGECRSSASAAGGHPVRPAALTAIQH